MKHQKNNPDLIKVQHMITALEELFSFIGRKKRKDLDRDRMLALSIVKEIEIVGEAASQISDKFKQLHHDIPWQDMVDIRNRLIHGCGDINYDIVWSTIVKDLKPLLRHLKSCIE